MHLRFGKFVLQPIDALPWFFGVVLVFVLVAGVKLVIRQHEVNSEVRDLEERVAKLRQENREVSELLAYVKSPAFVEETARLRFGVAPPDEQLFIASALEGAETGAGTVDGAGSASDTTSWWQYFFPR